jgi:hypothetical protein
MKDNVPIDPTMLMAVNEDRAARGGVPREMRRGQSVTTETLTGAVRLYGSSHRWARLIEAWQRKRGGW